MHKSPLRICSLACAILFLYACGGGGSSSGGGGGEFADIAGTYRGKSRITVSQSDVRDSESIVEDITVVISPNGAISIRDSEGEIGTGQASRTMLETIRGDAATVLDEPSCTGEITLLLDYSDAPQSVSGIWGSEGLVCFGLQLSVIGTFDLPRV